MSDAFQPPAAAHITFWVASAIAVIGALAVVTIRDVFKAAVFLATSFIGVAVMYFLLQAEFVGVVQILVYVGAVSILIAFAVMLIRDMAGGNRPSSGRVASATVAALVFAAVAFTAYAADWTPITSVDNADAVAGLVQTYTEEPAGAGGELVVRAAAPGTPGAQPGVLLDSTPVLGSLIVRDFLLPFQTIGLVLLAALIGGLVLMRDERRAR